MFRKKIAGGDSTANDHDNEPGDHDSSLGRCDSEPDKHVSTSSNHDRACGNYDQAPGASTTGVSPPEETAECVIIESSMKVHTTSCIT